MDDLDLDNKPMGEEQATNGLPNGLANGTSEHKEHKEHKHKSKDRDKDKDRHRDKDRHKSSHKDKDRDKSRDKDRHSSSHKSSHKDKEKDKEREKTRDKDKDRHRDKERSDRDKDKERSDKDKERSDRDKDKERSDRDKDKERSDRDKDKERSDRDKDKERSDRDKEKSREKDERHKDKERSDKHKERRDKDRERSDKHKDRTREREKDDKDRSRNRSSSSQKDRHHSSHKSSHKDKHRDRDREREKQQVKEEKTLLLELDIKEEVDVKKESDEAIDGGFSSMEDFQPLVYNQQIKDESEEESHLVIKEEKLDEDYEEDIPLAARKRAKVEEEDENDDDDKPLMVRKKVKSEKKRKKTDEDEDEDFKPTVKKVKKEKAKKQKIKSENVNKRAYSIIESPTKGRKKKEEENVWKWWEEQKREDGKKWTYLEHKGPVFAEPYVRLPSNVKFYYHGQHMVLSESAEEAAGFYARMLDHDYATKEIFNKNFFKDWRKTMTPNEKETITAISHCDFKKLHTFFVQQNEERKNRTKEEKKALKEKNEHIIAEYGWCIIDGHKQRIGNFKIEPPGLFRGRGEHPKQGMLKKRTMPEDVTINCSSDSNIPVPPAGRKWKEVRHDSTVTWLACWNENIQGSTKYVMLNAASKLKGEKDWQKYETARKLHKYVDKIRENYRADWKSKEMRIRQRGVALYFIDKLALRAGNEKDEDQADTVGCCSLRVEHLKLFEKKGGKDFVVMFDFLGKDSIRYYNEVPVEKRVFKNLQLFMENKQNGDDLFDRLTTQILNKYLNELLEGLTAKVFRTYNASRTLQEQLEKMTDPDDPLPAQLLSYNRANREVAILCNHQRAVPKTFDKSMANLQKKIDDKKEQIHETERDLKDLKKAAKHGGTVKEKMNYDKKKKAVDKLKEQLKKLEISATDKEENKQIALGTSKLNYLDPRITVAWCKKNNIPIEKVYNKTQRQKFQWAIDMATSDYNFTNFDENDNSFSRNSGDYDDDEDQDEEE